MSAIRVLIGDMPPMLHSMVIEMLQSEDDIVLLESGSDAPGGEDDVDGSVDVILTSQSHLRSDQRHFGGLAALSPQGIVAIADDASEATIIHFSTSNWSFADSQKDSIGAAIRIAARPQVKH